MADANDEEHDAYYNWLTTEPTTLPGVIATLEHASHRQSCAARHKDVWDGYGDDDEVCSNLFEAPHR